MAVLLSRSSQKLQYFYNRAKFYCLDKNESLLLPVNSGLFLAIIVSIFSFLYVSKLRISSISLAATTPMTLFLVILALPLAVTDICEIIRINSANGPALNVSKLFSVSSGLQYDSRWSSTFSRFPSLAINNGHIRKDSSVVHREGFDPQPFWTKQIESVFLKVPNLLFHSFHLIKFRIPIHLFSNLIPHNFSPLASLLPKIFSWLESE